MSTKVNRNGLLKSDIARPQLTRRSLRLLCWQRGYHGVADLARILGRNRVTIHRAVANPKQFGPTYALICKALSL